MNGLVIDPQFADATKWLAYIAIEAGEFSLGVSLFHRLKLISQADSQILLAKAFAFEQMDLSVCALSSASSAAVLDPANPEVWRSLGKSFRLTYNLQKAQCAFAILKNLNPEDSHFRLEYAETLFANGDLDCSIIQTLASIVISPHVGEAYTNYGEILRLAHQLDISLKNHRRGISINPWIPDIYTNLGIVLGGLQCIPESVKAHRQSIILKPEFPEAYSNLGSSLTSVGKFRQALIYYRKCNIIDPSLKDAIWGGLVCSAKSFMWIEMRSFLEMAKSQIDGKKSSGNPFPLLFAIDNPDLHRRSAEIYNGSFGISNQKISFCRKRKNEQIHLGFYSSDLRDHPVFKNISTFLINRDRKKFRLTAFSFLPVSDPSIAALFDKVIDVSSSSDETVSLVSRSEGVDIAIDLNGYTAFCRPGIFSLKPAPIVVNFLGYPGTMGGGNHDYIVSDDYVIPNGFENLYSEKVSNLPHFFMPYGFSRKSSNTDKGLNRQDYGLPYGEFVYCSFNEFHKISPSVFYSWVNILKATRGSILWIALRGDISSEELIEMFVSNGVSSEKIVLANHVKNHEEHIDRLGLADLMLDTYPYNSHTTACDAIMAGLPILTVSGESFASRVTGSLLNSVGVSELIAEDPASYESEAIRMFFDREYYLGIKAKLRNGAKDLPDALTYTRNLEDLLCRML